jgi:hypothetical protein
MLKLVFPFRKEGSCPDEGALEALGADLEAFSTSVINPCRPYLIFEPSHASRSTIQA